MKNKPYIILIGGGGHCRSVIDVIELENKYIIAGIIDNNLEIGTKILDYEVIGNDNDLEKFQEKYKYAIITIGQIKTSQIRRDLFNILQKFNYILPTIISPLAYVSKHSKIQEGTIIMHNAFINVNVKIGQNCIINTKALIEHDVIIENNCHISTGAIINGGTIVKENIFVGSNATTKEYIEVNKFVKAGSLIR